MFCSLTTRWRRPASRHLDASLYPIVSASFPLRSSHRLPLFTPLMSRLKPCCQHYADRSPCQPTPQVCASSIPVSPCHARRAQHLASWPLFGTYRCQRYVLPHIEPLLYVPSLPFRPRPSGPPFPHFSFCSIRAWRTFI